MLSQICSLVLVKIQTTFTRVENSVFCSCFRIAGEHIIISWTLSIDWLFGIIQKNSLNNFGLTTLGKTWLEWHNKMWLNTISYVSFLLLNWIIRVQSWMWHKISRNCKEYLMFITLYSFRNVFNGIRLASEDITKQNNGVIVLKANVTLGWSKDNFLSQGGCFHPFFSNLIGGKCRGLTLYT